VRRNFRQLATSEKKIVIIQLFSAATEALNGIKIYKQGLDWEKTENQIKMVC